MSTPGNQNRSGAVCAALALVLFSALFSTGCAYGELQQVLRAEVASEADCAEVVVQKSSPYAPGYKNNQFTVRGCKVDRVYTCKGDGLVAYGHADCTYVAGGTVAKSAAPAPPVGDSSDPALAPPPPADPDQPDEL